MGNQDPLVKWDLQVLVDRQVKEETLVQQDLLDLLVNLASEVNREQEATLGQLDHKDHEENQDKLEEQAPQA